MLLLSAQLTAGAIAGVCQLDQVGAQSVVPVVLLGTSLAVGLLGLIVFQAMIGSSLASRSSSIAMNRIKEYFIQDLHKEVLSIDKAFLWRMYSIPRRERFGSVTFV